MTLTLPRFAFRLLHLWFLASRGITLGVRAAVIDAKGRVLLVRHTYVAGWHLPGGGVELGETALVALERELAEEGNVALAGPPRLHGVFLNRQSSRRDHVLIYEVRAFRDLGPRTADREIAETAFFPLDALPAETTAGTRLRLEEIGGRREPAAEWV